MKLFLISFVLAGMLLGCDSDSASVITDQGVADPFLLGNYWIYDQTDYGIDGVVLSRSQDTLNLTYRSGNAFELDGNRLYRMDSGIYNTDWLFYKYPASIGDTMFVTSEMLVKAADSIFRGRFLGTVSGVNIPVSTPAGAFIVYKYYVECFTKDNIHASRLVSYFSPTVGVIKEEYYQVGSSFDPPLRLILKKELSSYKIR